MKDVITSAFKEVTACAGAAVKICLQPADGCLLEVFSAGVAGVEKKTYKSDEACCHEDEKDSLIPGLFGVKSSLHHNFDINC